MQRILIIGAVVIVLLGGGVFAYFAYLGGDSRLQVTPPTNNPTLPEAGSATSTPTTGTVEPIVIPNKPEQVTARLVQVTKGPVVSGAVVYLATTTPPIEYAVNYLERQSGNVYQYLVRAKTLTRISNKTIPGIQEALWLPDGSTTYIRYLSGDTHTTINTYVLPKNGVDGHFLAQGIASLGVSSANLLSLASGVNGSIGTVSKIDGSGSKQAFISPLTSLRASFAGKNQYIAFSKPSAFINGYAFLVNSTGNFERVAGPFPGLVALPGTLGKWVLFSYTSGGITKMSLVEVASREIVALPVATIADKCVWNVRETAVYCAIPIDPPTTYAYPDDWYQGAVFFSDRIWKIDVDGRFAELVLDFKKETDADLDAVNLALDPTENILVFKNKRDGSLWSYEI